MISNKTSKTCKKENLFFATKLSSFFSGPLKLVYKPCKYYKLSVDANDKRTMKTVFMLNGTFLVASLTYKKRGWVKEPCGRWWGMTFTSAMLFTSTMGDEVEAYCVGIKSTISMIFASK